MSLKVGLCNENSVNDTASRQMKIQPGYFPGSGLQTRRQGTQEREIKGAEEDQLNIVRTQR